MSQDLGEIDLLPGQTIVIKDSKPPKVNYNAGKTRVRVTAQGTWVDPVPPVEPPPSTDPTRPVVPAGWREAYFLDGADFKGVVTQRNGDGSYVYDGKLLMYADSWPDTYKYGYRNSPGNLSVVDGVLRGHMFTGSDGKGRGVHAIPVVPGGSDLSIQRVEWRARADLMPDFYWAHLVWPKGDIWPQYGELDIAEGALDGRDLTCYIHIQNGGPNGEGQIATPLGVKAQSWHNFLVEFSAAKYVKVWVDGVQKVNLIDTTKVPAGPMHWVWQNEVVGHAPAAGESGYTDLKYLSVQAPA